MLLVADESVNQVLKMSSSMTKIMIEKHHLNWHLTAISLWDETADWHQRQLKFDAFLYSFYSVYTFLFRNIINCNIPFNFRHYIWQDIVSSVTTYSVSRAASQVITSSAFCIIIISMTVLTIWFTPRCDRVDELPPCACSCGAQRHMQMRQRQLLRRLTTVPVPQRTSRRAHSVHLTTSWVASQSTWNRTEPSLRKLDRWVRSTFRKNIFQHPRKHVCPPPFLCTLL